MRAQQLANAECFPLQQCANSVWHGHAWQRMQGIQKREVGTRLLA